MGVILTFGEGEMGLMGGGGINGLGGFVGHTPPPFGHPL